MDTDTILALLLFVVTPGPVVIGLVLHRLVRKPSQ